MTSLQEKGAVSSTNQEFTEFEQVNKKHTYHLADTGTEEFDESFEFQRVSMKKILQQNPSEQDLQDFAQELGSALSEIGFAILCDTNIDPDWYDTMDKEIQKFFEGLSMEEKQRFKAQRHGSVNQGYFGVKETSNIHPDLVEGWVFCRRAFELPENRRDPNLKVTDFWPSEENEKFFRQHVEKHEPLIKPIMQSILRYLKSPLDQYPLNNTNFGFRLNYYPSTQVAPTGNTRMLGHEDVDLFTILPAPNVEGLQVWHHGLQKWTWVRAPRGSIILNVGDYIQRITNDILPSTTHRVAKPKHVKVGDFTPTRTSFPMAIYVWEEEILSVLPNLENPHYPPIDAETFHTRITSKFYGKEYANKNK